MISPPEKKPKIAAALLKNQKVAQDVEHSERELAVVHAVLDKIVPATQREGEIGQAVAKTDDVAKQLTESVVRLHDVNNTLIAELEARQQSPSQPKGKP
jgi:hypothetical protein